VSMSEPNETALERHQEPARPAVELAMEEVSKPDETLRSFLLPIRHRSVKRGLAPGRGPSMMAPRRRIIAWEGSRLPEEQ